jgi:hypothetical protein
MPFLRHKGGGFPQRAFCFYGGVLEMPEVRRLEPDEVLPLW